MSDISDRLEASIHTACVQPPASSTCPSCQAAIDAIDVIVRLRAELDLQRPVIERARHVAADNRSSIHWSSSSIVALIRCVTEMDGGGTRPGQSPADLTGWCATDRHQRCDGTLHTGTGYHWFCICDCHPEPPSITVDEQRAHKTWQRSRSAAPIVAPADAAAVERRSAAGTPVPAAPDLNTNTHKENRR